MRPAAHDGHKSNIIVPCALLRALSRSISRPSLFLCLRASVPASLHSHLHSRTSKRRLSLSLSSSLPRIDPSLSSFPFRDATLSPTLIDKETRDSLFLSPIHLKIYLLQTSPTTRDHGPLLSPHSGYAIDRAYNSLKNKRVILRRDRTRFLFRGNILTGLV